MTVNRIHYVLLAAAAILLLLGLAHQHDQVRDTINQAWGSHSSGGSPESSHSSSSSSLKSPPPPVDTSSKDTDALPSFHDIATKYGTDKVTTHHYWFMYDKHFPAIRNKRLKMLEIGLGCDMVYGPGKSYYTWLEYFPNVDLYYMEYDAECAAKWAAKTSDATIFAGDQADPAFLQKFIDESGGDFDIIIDDGGHTMNQQKVSFEALWKIVKPGGFYFVEDLQTSFMASYGGDPSGGKDPKVWTMAKYIYELIDDKLTPDGTRHSMSMEMRSIECQREVCLFTKKEKGSV
ncbi:putative Methyltransferase domain-containing protein [Seiridium unicorne]|uniref:Methyltransferase domain-containing protein n=1 Tax=Seiridium unicorne TaxID=138068 RepID=A0ABR2UXL4_9PEZI